MENQYDAIVIGSGIGGLSTAAFLSKAFHKKVLVLEKHWTLGGLTHEFERKRKYTWDVGVHYLGAMEKGALPRDLFDYISDGTLQWNKIKDPYDTFCYPDFKFEAVAGEKPMKASIIAQFPEESAAIEQYFKDIQKAAIWGRNKFLAIATPQPMAMLMNFLAKQKEDFFLQSAQGYFDTQFKSKKLKSLLLSQWGDYGTAPSKAVFWIHASIVSHYMNGAYYPDGGGKRIAASIIPVIERSGGQCLSNCDVSEIIVENGKAIGVRYKELKGGIEQVVYATKIISDAGAKNTFRKLLKKPIHPELDNLNGEVTAVTIYMGLKESPTDKFGVTGGNFWFFENENHNKTASKRDLINGKIEMCYLSFPSLKDSSKTAHTAEIVALTNYENFSPWAQNEWQNRGEHYQAIKDKIAAKFLAYLDTKFEGFSDNVDFIEVSTPLSLEKFTSRQKGAMYGLPCTKERFQMDCLQPKTAIKNLYLTGGDAFMLGVCGALLGGLAAAAVAGSAFGVLSLMPRITVGLKEQNKKQAELPVLGKVVPVFEI